MNFTKAEVNGNDFIIIEDINHNTIDVQKIADRRNGIGADQIIFAYHKDGNIYEVVFFNNDGSRAAMCGNGLCALTKYLNKSKNVKYIIDNREYEGFIDKDNACCLVSQRPTIIKEGKDMKFVDIGNKHIVCTKENLDILSFNEEYNIHFLNKIEDNTLRITTYERGAGKTPSCGSGAIASAYAYGVTNGWNYIIHDEGKSLVDFSNPDVAVLKTFPNIVFVGTTLSA